MMHFRRELILILTVCSVTVVSTTTPAEEEDDDYDNYDGYDDFTDTNSTSNGTLQFVKELGNITRESGKTVKFRCEVKDLDVNATKRKIRFTWLKNHAPVEGDDRIKINTVQKPNTNLFISKLKISDVDFLDGGFYACRASNGVDKIISEGTLSIIRDTWGKDPKLNSQVPTHKPLFSSISRTSSLPDLTTFLPRMESKERHVVLSTASDPFSSTMGRQEVEIVHPTHAYNPDELFCQNYEGTICKDLFVEKFVFIQPPYSQKNIEDILGNAFLVVSQSNDISSSCSKFVRPSLCYSAFPICGDPEAINNYQEKNVNALKLYQSADRQYFKHIRDRVRFLQRICRDDCEHLENELCRREYAIAKSHPVIGQALELEECESLPNDTMEDDGNCLALGIDRSQNVNAEDTCYWDNGELYRGVHDSSNSFRKCIKWSHQFQIPLSEHPELTGHSYCRNPSGEEPEPFCFVAQNEKETCGIPKCANIIWFYIAIAASVFAVVAVSVIGYLCVRRKRSKRNRLQKMNVPSADKNIYGKSGPSSPMELNTLLPNHPIPNIPSGRNQNGHKNGGIQNVPQYTYREVKFVEELGEGAFGKVYKGELKTKQGKLVVAVKSLKENASAKTQSDFQREIELISELRHPNIICLLGIVIKQEPFCMLFEFMSEGDLHEFLISNSPNEGRSLSQTQFLTIAVQIAQGMEYLSENHYVHRDLAARNCLVSKELVVKISDFGLSRDTYSCDYYRVQSKSLLPVRWMPPESILYGKFTTESDVWSYGVVLWEIYSYGLQPYYGYNNQEVINMIRSRKLLPCPECCPSYCYALMVECWAELSMRRPTFNEIVHRLKMWKENGSTAGAYFKSPEVHTNLNQKSSGSKSSHLSEPNTVLCPGPNSTNTWEKNLKKTSAAKLNESQSSLTSHNSSLGNRTQSTNLSNEQNGRGSRRSAGKVPKSSKTTEIITALPSPDGPKNTVVNKSGDTFETQLSF